MPEGSEETLVHLDIPQGVTVSVERGVTQQGKVGWVKVSGPLGSCNYSLAGTAIKLEEGKVSFWGNEKDRVEGTMRRVRVSRGRVGGQEGSHGHT
jgi:ribosomal protein L6P/L9E